MDQYLVRKGSDIEYFISVQDTDKGTLYILKRSYSKTWSENAQGVVVVSIVDNGNCIAITMETGKFKSMDYAQQRELQILLTFIQDNSNLDDKVSILKIIDEQEL